MWSSQRDDGILYTVQRGMTVIIVIKITIIVKITRIIVVIPRLIIKIISV